MFGIWRRGIAPAVSMLFVPAVALVLSGSQARAGDLDAALADAKAPEPTLFGESATKIKTVPAEESTAPSFADEIARLWAEDFHPETDRWTERNNRIKLTAFASAMFFGDNLRIHPDGAAGVRISWEVPGFIGIRLDTAGAPWSHFRVRDAQQTLDTGDHSRFIQGFFDVTSLSIAIFNPELSFAPNLAMWAGFGLDVWSYHYDALIGSQGTSRRYQFVDFNAGGNLFFNLEYRIVDVFHIGMELREHVVYAPQTERGEFYKIDNIIPGIGLHTIGSPHSRNQNLPVALSAVEEFQLHISVVF